MKMCRVAGHQGLCHIWRGGDLTHRLLVPALYNLASAGLLDSHFSIIVVDRADVSAADLRQSFHDSLENFVTSRGTEAVTLHDDVWKRLSDNIDYVRGAFEETATYDALARKIGNQNCIFYLAVAARFFGTIVDQLGVSGLAKESGKAFRRVIIEKPFGSDLQSAIALNERLLRTLGESQIYRIDHYLGKETVQNILALRFSNGFRAFVEPRQYRPCADYGSRDGGRGAARPVL